jgi:dienelactone hydrolase
LESIDLGAGDRRVFVRGAGPAVIIVHEMPGITPQVEAFARRVADDGFTVFLPELFGKTLRSLSAASFASAFAEVCVARTFHLFSRGGVGPILDEMRALCRIAELRCAGRGVGVLGMCLTGNFALALALEPCVRAPVLAQPALPFAVPGLADALAVPEAHGAAGGQRLIAEDRVLLGVRFTGDPLCPGSRFERLRAGLGDRFEGIEIDSAPGNLAGHRRLAHSPLTNDLVDEPGQPTRAALDRVLAFFEENLRQVRG